MCPCLDGRPRPPTREALAVRALACQTRVVSAFSGRDVQSRIYRAGVFGRRPVVPVEPARLAAAARRRMSPAAWAYVAGSAGQQQTARANVEAFARHRLVPRMLVDVETRDTSVELFGRRLPAPLLLAPIGVLEMAHRDADLAAARAARALGLPMVDLVAGLGPDGAARPPSWATRPRWFQLYWSKDDDVVDSFVDRAAAIGSDALVVTLDTHVLGWRTTRPRPRLPAVRPRGGHRAVHERPGVPPAGATRAPRRRRRRRDRPTPAAVRALLVDGPRTTPATCATNLRSPLPRAAVETFLDVFSRLVADLGRPGPAARAHLACRSCSRGSSTPTTPGSRSTTGSTASSCPTTAAGRSTARSARSTRCPASSRRSTAGSPSCSTAASAAAPTWSRRSRSARPRVLVGRPWVYGLALAGADGARAVLEHLWAELDLTMALCGVRSIDQIGPDLLAEAP